MIPHTSFEAKRQPFAAKNPLVERNKPIIVFIDRDSIEECEELRFLLRQADGERLIIVSTKNDGTSLLEYKPIDQGVLGFSVKRLDNKGETHYALPFVHQYKRIASTPEFARYATPEAIERALIAASTFESMDAHIFITHDKFLLENKDIGFIANSFPMNIIEATAVVGLILRRRNDFDIVTHRKGASTITFQHSRWLFFWYAARDLLPEAWRLVTGCAQLQTNKCRDLALTAISRTVNALKSRDHIHEQLYLEQNNSSTEDAIYYLDLYLISFTAAFDVLARIVDEIYQPCNKKGRRLSSIGWRKNDWLNALNLMDPQLANLMQSNSFNRDILDFIANLRNYIHAEGLRGSMQSKNGKQAPMLLHVPEDEVLKIAAIIKRIFGGSWKVENPTPTHMWLEIGELVERITPLAIQALNKIMESIDLTRIPNYDPSRVQATAPEKWPTKQELRDIRMLLGL